MVSYLLYLLLKFLLYYLLSYCYLLLYFCRKNSFRFPFSLSFKSIIEQSLQLSDNIIIIIIKIAKYQKHFALQTRRWFSVYILLVKNVFIDKNYEYIEFFKICVPLLAIRCFSIWWLKRERKREDVHFLSPSLKKEKHKKVNYY
jgi:hypothetical protein